MPQLTVRSRSIVGTACAGCQQIFGGEISALTELADESRTQSAAVAADVAVLPIQPGPFDFWAVAETLESLDQADRIREQLGRAMVRRVFVINRAGTNTRLAREAEAELRKSGGELAGVVHQRIAFPDAASRGESVLTSSSTEAAADDVRRLWRELKGRKRGS